MITKLGVKVRTLRGRKGWTQAELATQLGLSANSKGYVSEIESGKKIPPAERLVQLARVLDVSIDYLLRDDLDENGHGGQGL